MSKKKLSNMEIAAFCEQLAFMVRAGISLQEALMIIREDAKNSKGSDITVGLLECVEEGQTLGAALTQSEVFPDYMVHMVEIGEASGKLEEVLESLYLYYERNESISRSIRSAITYPLVMIAMMIAVILVIIVQVLPVFEGVFQQLGSEVPAIVQGIMEFGNAVSQYSVVIVAVIAVLIVIVLITYRSRRGRNAFSNLFEKIFRKLATTISSGRFASAMALMLGSGMDVDQALDMSFQLTENAAARKKIERTKELMAEGKAFADAIVETELFTGVYGRMITVGFRTGTLDSVMQRIAQHYEEDIERKIGALVSALEPTLVAILSLIVGLILLAVMLPLMGVMSAIG
ncbi:type II secretion system F family protein [Christensenellaceae bacterium OttesenSCG-928-K19]|nr:type II secretion system F family protein [Christensenellaceae bacterium OttesenSCG-928-K19]